MSTRRVMVELPESIFQELARIAELTNQSLEIVAAQRITTNLPPSIANAPPEMQGELLLMQTLPVEELLKIAHSNLSAPQQERHLELLEKNQAGSITVEESQELSDLRITADQLMLRKAYAWSVLSWRGHRIPTLNELPLE
ncbi:MAG TPA: hypothetical protein V6D28_04290 [Leptolyngbyaceae cyanobacterium]